MTTDHLQILVMDASYKYSLWPTDDYSKKRTTVARPGPCRFV